jgi:hypothetical protein
VLVFQDQGVDEAGPGGCAERGEADLAVGVVMGRRLSSASNAERIASGEAPLASGWRSRCADSSTEYVAVTAAQ